MLGRLDVICDYCGGYTVEKEGELGGTTKDLSMKDHETGKETIICSKCIKSFFDKVKQTTTP